MVFFFNLVCFDLIKFSAVETLMNYLKNEIRICLSSLTIFDIRDANTIGLHTVSKGPFIIIITSVQSV